MDIHVSPLGNDAWSGRLPEPAADGNDGPLATLHRSLVVARASGRIASEPVCVWLREGTYKLESPLVFKEEDSGSSDFPFTYKAWPGEKAVVSGGEKITQWRQTEINGMPCWVADLPAVRAGDWTFSQLFVNGRRRYRSRFPKTGYYRFAGFDNKRKDQAKFNPGDLHDWHNIEDVKVVSLQVWDENHLRVQDVDTASETVRFQAPAQRSMIDEQGRFSRYFVENVFEALTHAGEWYLDRRAGRLYYLPEPDETPESTEVVAPKLEQLVLFSGTFEQPVQHVRMENISFQHAEWEYPSHVTGSGQAAIFVGGAIAMEWSRDCVLYGCEIAHIGQYGIDIRPGCSGNQIVACIMHDMGGGGVRIGSTQKACAGHVEHSALPVMNCVISDCEIYDGSLIYYSAIGVWIGNNGHNRIVHNHIHDMNYTGISCGWTWGYGETGTLDNRIEYNHIHHINWNRLLSDNGGIYTLGNNPGSTIRGNLIHHIGRFSYGGWGIYPDEGTSAMLIEENLVYACDGPAFSTHYGRDNLVRNNIFALCGSPHIRPGKKEQHCSTFFSHNIVYWQDSKLDLDVMPGHYIFHHNLFWGGSRELDFGGGMTLRDWQEMGQHEHSAVADPLFHNPAAGDFTLRDDSPALALGFKPFDPQLAGPRCKATRAAAYEGFPQLRFDPVPIIHTRLELREQTVVVKVENLGDLAASGRLRLRGNPEGEVAFTRIPVICFNQLPPGRSEQFEFSLRGEKPKDKQFYIACVPETGPALPTILLIVPPAATPVWPISCLPATARQDLPAAMENLPVRELVHFKHTVAEIRAAKIEDSLALAIAVKDACVKRGKPLFYGSCIQFFSANPNERMPNPAARNAQALRHIFLAPAADGETDLACIVQSKDFSLVPSTEITHFSRRINDGYEAFAMIPFSLLRIPVDASSFYCEIMIDHTPSPGVAITHSTLFGSTNPSVNNCEYGIVRIT